MTARDDAVDALLASLTLEERASLLDGSDFWHTQGLPERGVPAVMVTDGPHGARGGTFGENRAASFPCGTALGATWNPDLVRDIGAAAARLLPAPHAPPQ